jgi:hypothetical protein
MRRRDWLEMLTSWPVFAIAGVVAEAFWFVVILVVAHFVVKYW